MDRDEIMRVLRAFQAAGLESAALYRLKKGTIRLQDQEDAAALRERFDLKDED